MKITGSAISMSSSHSIVKTRTTHEIFNLWGIPSGDNNDLKNLPNETNDFKTVLSEKINEVLDQHRFGSLNRRPTNLALVWDLQKMEILERFLSKLFGRPIKLRIIWRDSISQAFQPLQIPLPRFNSNIYQETEKLTFTANGIIKTADGKEINFNTRLGLDRMFVTKNNLQIETKTARLTDPLVINFDGPGADLTDTKFSFDLDVDGDPDQISFLREGSGFLVQDLNKDGVANNGDELFGPTTGNGFTDLAWNDRDQNGWIDENDPIYDQLRIWTKNSEGEDVLFALGQKGIGAIYLGNTEAPFEIYSQNHQLQGKSQSLGIFVRENGTVGTVQQVDLA